ncbi:MAG: FHA domain-containing protein [Betaproteobacteria bacterium]
MNAVDGVVRQGGVLLEDGAVMLRDEPARTHAPVWIDLLRDDGQPAMRQRFAHLPLVVGRGYDCDLVLCDSRVAARHFLLSRVEGGALRVEPLAGARIGVAGGPPSCAAQVFDATGLLHIGTTRLRVSCKPIDSSADRSAPIPPATATEARGAGAGKIALGVLMAMAGGAVLALPDMLRGTDEPSFKPLAYAAITWVILLALWAAIWMGASKLIGGTSQWPRHVRIAGATMLMLALAALLVPYGAAALGLPKTTLSATTVTLAWLACATALHLRALPLTGRRLAAAVAAVLGTWLGIAALRWSDVDGLPTPPIAEVLPVGMLPVRAERRDQTMSAIEALRESADHVRAIPLPGASESR